MKYLKMERDVKNGAVKHGGGIDIDQSFLTCETILVSKQIA